jgi:wyosine [tRNA(Phe)-imidazoG37] synthetase (radical SAM superfamily)
MITPGRGAAHAETPCGEYVYAVHSRRSGGLSIGVDIVAEGACPIACDYCQVPRTGRITSFKPVWLPQLGEELRAALDAHPDAVDIVFAGSGEPTWSPFFAEALDVAVKVAVKVARNAAQNAARSAMGAAAIPVRVLTSGITLEWTRVGDALRTLVEHDGGEVWVKLDTWDERTIARVWAARGQDRHEARILRFAREVPVVVQSLVVDRGDPDLAETAEGLAAAIARLHEGGAQIRRVLLGTMSRPPGSGDVSIAPYGAKELSEIGEAIRRRTGLEVATFAMPQA